MTSFFLSHHYSFLIVFTSSYFLQTLGNTFSSSAAVTEKRGESAIRGQGKGCAVPYSLLKLSEVNALHSCHRKDTGQNE